MAEAMADDRAVRVGCVSYINAKPLIDGLDGCDLELGVPSLWADRLVGGDVDVALCPVVDYFTAADRLRILPVGMIGCEGPTLTVKVFSRVPIDRIGTLALDGDSHTSVVLVRLLLEALYGVTPERLPLDRRDEADAVLLIGDKVITAAPDRVGYPFEMDLGEAWHRMTALPFVFALWMVRADAAAGQVSVAGRALEARRESNAGRIGAIAGRYAAGHGWPVELAEEYMRRVLKYAVDERALLAVRRFAELAGERGLLPGGWGERLPLDVVREAEWRAVDGGRGVA
ncbi:MAG: menaquinone biosynthesis protein [Planctomycetota bacterium]